ncbi:retinol-binding protein 3 [Aplochiton taeniatus]
MVASTQLIPALLVILLSHTLSTSPPFQPALVLDMAQILLENYCFPENLIGMQEAIEQAIHSGDILQISDRKTLAAVLTAGVQGALNDPRLAVSYEPNFVPIMPPALPSLPPEQLIRLVRNSVKLEIFEDNVGYLRIDRIIGKETDAKLGPLLRNNIWNRVAHTSSLIFDLRYSTTGELSGVPFIISYFSDPEPLIHISTVFDRPFNTTSELWTVASINGERYGKTKDLIVLTSKRTVGAAEAVAYTLKHLKRAIIVGERTAGGSVRVQKIHIGESGFYITVPAARSVNPITGQSWEVSGVAPSVNIPAKEAMANAQTLLAVRRAVPKAVKSISDLIWKYYAFPDRVPAILSHLQATDFFSVTSEENLVTKINHGFQSLSEDPRLVLKLVQDHPVSAKEDHEPEKVQGDAEFLATLVDTVFIVRVLPGNIGYLRFNYFLAESVMGRLGEQIGQKVWEPLKDTENLVIDLRSNTGGPSASLAGILSYLQEASEKRLFFTIYDRIQNTTTAFQTLSGLEGPAYGSKRGLYVLTSYHTASAGEEFAYLIQSLHRGTVIGEITAGTLTHSKTFPVEDTDIVITIPFMNFIDNNGECWLGGGVVPDAIVLSEDAMDHAREVIEFHREVRSLVDQTGELLEMHYAVPEVATKVSQVLLDKWAEGLYRSVVDYESLASQLTADLQETSGDHRLHIFYCDVEPESMRELPKIPTPEEVGYIVDALFKTDVMPGNVGYLRFDMMADVEVVKAIGTQLIKLVWDRLVNTDTLVIDMRYNTGGYSTAIPLICTYFFDAEPLRHLYTVFDRSTTTITEVMTLPEVMGQRYGSSKDIYILTSHMTGSASEAFTRTMKDLNRATVIGEPSIGGSLSSGTYQIGDSVLYASVPNQVVLSAVTGKVWSVSGVEPHIVTQAKDALTEAQRIILARRQKRDKRFNMAKVSFLVASLLVLGNVFLARAAFPPSLIVDMAKILMDNYCSPEKLAGMQEAIDAASSNTEILSIPDPDTLATVLSAGVQSTINDPRLVVSHEPNYVAAPPPQLPPLPPEQLIAVLQSSIKLEVLDGNIGYLRIDHIIGEEMANKIGALLLELVWKKILPTSALIFDLRYAGSGEVSGIPYIVSYFTEAEPLIHIDSVYDRPSDTTTELWSMPTLLGQRYGTAKPLVILTSKNTKGIAEDVAYCLSNLKRATIVGERTAGGSVKIDKIRVGDTDFYASVPSAKSINPITGNTWEVSGVTPSVEVAAEDALDAAIAIIRLRAMIPAIIQGSAAIVAQNYAFESVGAVAAEKLRGVEASGEYSMISSKSALEVKLTSDLQTLSGDKSLKTTSNIPALPPMNYTPEMFIELIKVSFHTDVFENNIGYLRFDMFGDFEEVKAIAQIIVEHVWGKVVNTDAMIVDLRNNVGGPTTAIAGFCSYFFDAEKPVLLDKLYNRPTGTTKELWTLSELTGPRYGTKKSLLILTSSATAGAAEEFVYIMKRLGRAMIVGETTNGASHPPETFAVGETGVFLSIPTVHSDTTQGPAWEGAGIAPHIPVPAEGALDVAKGILNKHFAGQQ